MYTLKNYGVTERFLAEATLFPAYQLGRIISQYRGKYKVATDDGEALAQISGKLHFQTEELAQYPAVGDFVLLTQETAESEAVIHQILTRKSIFLRKAVGVSGQAQAVAAVQEGRIDQRRLESYFKLQKEAAYDGLSSREIEAKKFERMFKEVGGMKNARKFTKEHPKNKGR